MELLKSKKFDDANDLCIYINTHKVKLENIVSYKNDIIAFYWEKYDSNFEEFIS